MFFVFFALRLVGASFLLGNTVYAMAMAFGILGLIPPFTYFFRQWHYLRRAGVFAAAEESNQSMKTTVLIELTN